MVRFIGFFFFLLITTSAKADYWDNLNLAQAKKVTAYIKKHPFIFDYCDCCSAEVYLMKVLSSEIVPCAWDTTQYSVITKVDRLALMEHSGTGLHNFLVYPVDENERFVDFTISMNYTFVYYAPLRWAIPFFKIIPHSTPEHVCKGATVFPDPTMSGVQIKDADYTAWYEKRIRK